MIPETEHPSRGRGARRSRTAVRYLTATLLMAVSALYLILNFLVFDAESQPDAVVTDTTSGAYLLLAIPYLIGAVLAALTDRLTLWIIGAVIQVLVIVLFVVFGVAAFEYEALSELWIELWAAVITGAQVILLGLLSYLATTRWRRESGQPAPSERPMPQRSSGASSRGRRRALPNGRSPYSPAGPITSGDSPQGSQVTTSTA